MIYTFKDFVTNEELTKLPLSYNYSNKKTDADHERLARKEKDGHKWVKSGENKTGKSDRVQKYKCKCGKTKTMKRLEDKMEVSYN